MSPGTSIWVLNIKNFKNHSIHCRLNWLLTISPLQALAIISALDRVAQDLSEHQIGNLTNTDNLQLYNLSRST